MDLYSELFESMVSCCGRIGLRYGPVNTLAMMALGLGVSLNILTIADVMWTLGLLANPYSTGGLYPQRYLCAMLYMAFLINTILARLKFSTDGTPRRIPRRNVSPAAAPTYVLGSAGLFLLTLAVQT